MLPDVGLIAEKVAEVFADLVTRNDSSEVMMVRYEQLVPLLLSERQKQHRAIREIPTMREQIQSLTGQLGELKHGRHRNNRRLFDKRDETGSSIIHLLEAVMSPFKLCRAAIILGIVGSVASLATADTTASLPTITLDRTVHFLAVDGKDIVIPPGDYALEAGKEGELRLISQEAGKAGAPLAVEAISTKHEESLSQPQGRAIPSGEDELLVVLLLPSGTGLMAVGSTSGVRSRQVYDPTASGRTSVPPPTYLSVVAGRWTACGIRRTTDFVGNQLPYGPLYCWGENGGGKLGNGTTSHAYTPVAVSGGRQYRRVSIPVSKTCAVASDEQLYCWGSPILGTGDLLGQLTPTLVPSTSILRGASMLWRVIGTTGMVSCGLGQPAATSRTALDYVYCWGTSSSGQLGTGTSEATYHVPARAGTQPVFKSVDGPDDRGHACALRSDGAAYCWGSNSVGQLGIGKTGGSVNTPTAVTGGLVFYSITVGGSHTCGVVATTRLVYCWGAGSRLGTGSIADSNKPVPIKLPGPLFKSVDAGSGHTCAITTLGLLYCWGAGVYGQLGNGGLQNTLLPVASGTSLAWKSVSAGTDFTCGLTTAHYLYCWGLNIMGALGTGAPMDARVPSPTLVKN